MHNKLEVDLLLLSSSRSSAEEFARLLCKCRYGRNRVYALRLYECICIKGLECDNVLGNYLVPLFVALNAVSFMVFEFLSLRQSLSSIQKSYKVSVLSLMMPYGYESPLYYHVNLISSLSTTVSHLKILCLIFCFFQPQPMGWYQARCSNGSFK